HYAGSGLEPDLPAIGAALGGRVTLLDASLEQIQGHAVGHLIIAVSQSPFDPTTLLENLRPLADHLEVLGYVAAA
ncbi:NIL domain-containing protein, partial [Pseudomonas sp. GW6]